MRLSLAGSSGWLGSTYASRLPLPLVSRMSAVQPCDFCASWVSSHIFVFSQPTTADSPPHTAAQLLVHSVLLASSANCRWCAVKQVSISETSLVFGSYTASSRILLLTGD